MQETTKANTARAPRIVRERELLDRLGISRATLWRRIRAGQFARPIKLGVRAVGWVESDIADFIERGRAAARGELTQAAG